MLQRFRHTQAGFFAAFLFLSISVGSHAQDPPVNPPNIIFILADDLGYGDLGCYGQKKILTPNIDKLAAEGMLFKQAYAGAAVCAPSRCSLMTGLHNGHNRVRDNLPHGVFLKPDDFTIPELLKKAGYVTGGIGKWSLGDPGTWGIPNSKGFDYWYGYLNQEHATVYYPENLWENNKEVPTWELVMKNDIGEMVGNRGDDKHFYSPDLLTGKAIDFIDRNQNNPFFLYLPYTLPHFSDYPWTSPDVYIVPSDAPYSGKDWSQTSKNYAAMISRLDRDIGVLIDKVKSLGLEKNTIIIFTSDNGPLTAIPDSYEFFNSNGDLRGGKRDLYEGGIRVPFIIKWKGKIRENSVSNVPIAFWDMLPTFAELVGYPGKVRSDGVSVLPVFSGNTTKPDRKYLYWDYGHVRKTFEQAIRAGDYKMIATSNDGSTSYELYDLEKDPGETKNVASAKPDVVAKMKKLLNEAYTPSSDYPRQISH